MFSNVSFIYICSILPRLIKYRALGLIIFESIWILCGTGKYIVSLYTRWHPVIPTRSERSDPAKRLSYSRKFLFSILFFRRGEYKDGKDVWHVTSELQSPSVSQRFRVASVKGTGTQFWLTVMNGDPTFRLHMENNGALLVLGSFLGK